MLFSICEINGRRLRIILVVSGRQNTRKSRESEENAKKKNCSIHRQKIQITDNRQRLKIIVNSKHIPSFPPNGHRCTFYIWIRFSICLSFVLDQCWVQIRHVKPLVVFNISLLAFHSVWGSRLALQQTLDGTIGTCLNFRIQATRQPCHRIHFLFGFAITVILNLCIKTE